MIKIFKLLYLRFSRGVLKAYFGIETPIYKRWRNKRAQRIQALLDKEHGTAIYSVITQF